MINSTPGLVALLEEDDVALVKYALEQMHFRVEVAWAPIADTLPKIIRISNQNQHPAKHIAALLVSEVYYYLDQLDNAVLFALKSDNLFQTMGNSQYHNKVMAHAVKMYIIASKNQCPEDILEELKQFILNFIGSLVHAKRINQALFIAFEMRYLNYVERILTMRPDYINDLLPSLMNVIDEQVFCRNMLHIFVNVGQDFLDKISLARFYCLLNDADNVAHILTALKSSSDVHDNAICYQIAFNTYENTSQHFRRELISRLPADIGDTVLILHGDFTRGFHLRFLFDNHEGVDLNALVTIKDAFDSSHAVIHIAVVLSYALMYAGTADDNFYRNNTQWFTNAKEWAQFTTAAAVGVIHMGHLQDGRQILQSFMRKNAPEPVFGGAVYALGLIYAGYSWDKKVLADICKGFKMGSPVILHGTCLALGLVDIGTHDDEHFRKVQRLLLAHPAPEVNEAAGYAAGMIMLGANPTEIIRIYLNFAESSHTEKTKRGLGMAIALMNYGVGDAAESLVETMRVSSHPIIRECAAWTCALANVGNASNKAVQSMLRLAVSDPNPFVRRAAVLGVGFILSRRPKDLPRILHCLSDSYDPFIKSACALALGIVCAGTIDPVALQIVRRLLSDSNEIVVQSAIIGMSMLLMQQNDISCPENAAFREYLRRLIRPRLGEMQVFGIATALGILNAGGRNVVISCNSNTGQNHIQSTVGLVLFCNYFFWHPLSLMLPLAFHPTCIIGLNPEMQLAPEWTLLCTARANLFFYPPPINLRRQDGPLPTPVRLSTSKGIDKPTTEKPRKNVPRTTQNLPTISLIPNGSRIIPTQLKYVVSDPNSQYSPVTNTLNLGITMVTKEKQGAPPKSK